MATSSTAIVEAIDAAILAGVAGPGEITCGERTIKYHSYDHLLKLRQYYASLSSQSTGKTGFKLNGLKAPSSRGTC